jgi:hypothetical protein
MQTKTSQVQTVVDWALPITFTAVQAFQLVPISQMDSIDDFRRFIGLRHWRYAKAARVHSEAI